MLLQITIMDSDALQGEAIINFAHVTYAGEIKLNDPNGGATFIELLSGVQFRTNESVASIYARLALLKPTMQ